MTTEFICGGKSSGGDDWHSSIKSLNKLVSRFLQQERSGSVSENHSPAIDPPAQRDKGVPLTDHPATRTESRRSRMELLRYVSEELKLVTGSETGHEAAAPFVHYFEGQTAHSKPRLAPG